MSRVTITSPVFRMISASALCGIILLPASLHATTGIVATNNQDPAFSDNDSEPGTSEAPGSPTEPQFPPKQPPVVGDIPTPEPVPNPRPCEFDFNSDGRVTYPDIMLALAMFSDSVSPAEEPELPTGYDVWNLDVITGVMNHLNHDCGGGVAPSGPSCPTDYNGDNCTYRDDAQIVQHAFAAGEADLDDLLAVGNATGTCCEVSEGETGDACPNQNEEEISDLEEEISDLKTEVAEITTARNAAEQKLAEKIAENKRNKAKAEAARAQAEKYKRKLNKLMKSIAAR